MAAKLFSIMMVVVMVVGLAQAYPPRYNNAQMNWQLPRLFQAACLMKNATSGEVVQEDECKCGDQTVACDVGPINHFGIEMTFCNKLDDQTDDQLYILQFACVSGQDANCGTGTFCDIGPLNYDGTEYFLCRLASSSNTNDDEDMCKPVDPLTQPPMLGLGAQFGRGAGRWAAAGQGNVPQPGPGMGWRWNQGVAPNGGQPANPPVSGQQQWGPGMGWRWNQAASQGNAQVNPPVNPPTNQQQWGPGMGWRLNQAASQGNALVNPPVNPPTDQQQWGPGMGWRLNQAASQGNAPVNPPVNPPTDQQQWGPGMGAGMGGGWGQGMMGGMGRRGGRRSGRGNW